MVRRAQLSQCLVAVRMHDALYIFYELSKGLKELDVRSEVIALPAATQVALTSDRPAGVSFRCARTGVEMGAQLSTFDQVRLYRWDHVLVSAK